MHDEISNLSKEIPEGLEDYLLMQGQIGSNMHPSLARNFPTLALLRDGTVSSLSEGAVASELEALDAEIARKLVIDDRNRYGICHINGSLRKMVQRLQLHNFAYVQDDILKALSGDSQSHLLNRYTNHSSVAAQDYLQRESLTKAYKKLSELDRGLARGKRLNVLHSRDRFSWLSASSWRARLKALFTRTNQILDADGFDMTGRPVGIIDLQYTLQKPNPDRQAGYAKANYIDITFEEEAEKICRSNVQKLLGKTPQDIHRLFTSLR